MKETINNLKYEIESLCSKARYLQPNRWETLSIINEYSQFLDLVIELSNILSEWMNKAHPGESLKENYQKIISQIQTLKENLNLTQQEYEKLSKKEQEWQQLLEQYNRLNDELKRLKHLQELVNAVDLKELERQVNQLKKKEELLKSADFEKLIADNSNTIIQLSTEAIEKLDQEIKETLLKAEATEKTVKQKYQELVQAREKYKQAQEEWEKLKPEFEAMLEADRRVAEALTNAKMSSILDKIKKLERIIKKIEKALGAAIKENEEENRKKENEKIFLGGS
jgi:DNA repair exonuclease SbcCD ATPase subunit